MYNRIVDTILISIKQRFDGTSSTLYSMLISHFFTQETLVMCNRELRKSFVNICWDLMIISLQDNFA